MKTKVQIANFNLTFGDDEPLLSHFDDIVYPAFKSDIIKGNLENSETSYFLHNVNLEKKGSDNFQLTGLIVKKTTLEIKSQINDGKLVDTDYEYPSAPYSYFCICLKNHRMYLVKNQNGSPDTKTFRATVSYILKEFVAAKNNEIIDERKKLPLPFLEVIGVPFKANIHAELNKVEKIQMLTLSFFPLNGDTDFNEAFENVSSIRRDLDSKKGRLVYNSPKNKENVAELLAQTKGTVNPILKVKYPDKESLLTTEELSEKIYIEVDEEGLIDHNILKIQEKMKTSETLNDLQGSHLEIFEKYKNKILSVFK